MKRNKSRGLDRVQDLERLSGQQWKVILLLWLVQIVAASIYYAFPATIPFIQAELKLTTAQVGLMTSALSFGQLLMVIPLGYFIDALGEKKILIWSLILIGVISLGISQVEAFSILLLALALIGTGYSSISPGTSKAIINWIPVQWRATAIGYKQTGPTLGGVVAAALVPLVAVIGWQNLYALLGGVTVIFAILLARFYVEAPGSSDHSQGTSGFSELFRLVFINKNVVLLGLAGLVLGANQFSLLTYTSLYMKDSLGFTAVIAGMSAGLIQATGAVGRFAGGLLSDRLLSHKRKPLIVAFAALSGCLCLLVASFTPLTPQWKVLTTFGIFGITALGFNGLYLTMVVELVGSRAGGLATSFAALAVVLGAVVAPPLMGKMVDNYGSYTVAWYSMAFLTIIAIGFLVALKEKAVDD